MYSTDLSSISLNTFERTILTIDLLPSRKVLAAGISDVVRGLHHIGIETLEDLRVLLRDKERYSELAIELGVDEAYLTVLNREVNSYVSKPVPLDQFDIFTGQELERLRGAGVRSTKAIYERCLLPADRAMFASEHSLDKGRLTIALELSDLVRINGVGPTFARFLRDLGIRSPREFNSIDPHEVLERYRRSVADGSTSGPQLRLEDLEYCRRFSSGLDNDIKW